MKRIAWCLVAAGLAWPAVAAANPTKRECIDTNADAQVQQKAGKLRAAQTALRTCANAACPGAVKDDCAQRLDALSAVIPSLLFDAKDASGGDLSAVKVTMDGQPLTEKLDGNPIEIDPGEHAFTFEAAGATTVTKKLVIRQGERSRRESIVLTTTTSGGAAPAVVTPSLSAEPPADPERHGSTQKTLGIVAGAAGLAGIGVGVVFGAIAGSKWSDAQDQCSSTSCPNRAAAEDTRQSALGLATGSTIAFIAGGVFLVGGAVLWFTAPSSSTRVGIAPSPTGGLVTGRF